MPISLGSVVRDTRKPPKFAATTKTTRPKSGPPGAAVLPTMTYKATHAMIPIMIMHHNRANWRKDGHNGKGQNFCHIGGSQDGVSSSPRHFIQNV